MKFKSIKIKNFMSIGKLELELADRGIVLVTGRNLDNPSSNSNGSGKSSIWDALIWALYGRVLREDVGADDILNRNRKGAFVKVKLEDDDGRIWTVRRTRGIKSSPSLDLHCDARNISAATSTTTQEKIISLVGSDFNSFASSIVFGQDTLRFSQLTDKDKKAVLERLLGLEIYDKAYKLVCQKLSAQKMIMELSKANWLQAMEQIKELRERWKQYNAKTDLEKKEIKLTIRKFKKLIREKKVELGIEERKLHKAEEVQSRVLNLQERKTYAQNEAARAKELFQEYNEEIATIGEQIQGLQDSAGRACPTCGQDMGAKSRRVAKAELKSRLGGLRSKAENIERHYRKNRRLAKKLGKRLEKFERNVNIVEIRAGVAKIRETITSLRTTVKLTRRNKSVSESTVKELEKQIKEKQDQASKEDESIKKQKHIHEKRKFWQFAFSPAGIRSYLMDGIVPYLDERAAYYSKIMTGGAITIKFNTVTKLRSGEYKDKFSVLAQNRDGADIYGGNSAGERQRIDLCVALALKDLSRSRNKNKLDIMVFDEAFEGLDEAGSERVIELLNKEAGQFGSAFIITHNDSLKQYFNERIEIVKENGKSSLEAS